MVPANASRNVVWVRGRTVKIALPSRPVRTPLRNCQPVGGRRAGQQDDVPAAEARFAVRSVPRTTSLPPGATTSRTARTESVVGRRRPGCSPVRTRTTATPLNRGRASAAPA